VNARPEGIAETPVAEGLPGRARPGRAPLELRLLGPLEVRRGGEAVILGGARQRALLALLCLHRDTVVAVDRIVDELWGESPPPTARHMVEVYVSKLRKLIGADVLATRPPGYLLQVDPEQVDVERFERLLAEGKEALDAGDPALAASTLADALAFWRGPPLADFVYEPFAQAEIARLEESRLLSEEVRIDAELELGRGAELVGDLEELVAQAPFRERFRAQLMLALYRAGRQADALAAYRSARDILVEELGVEPSQELRELERGILSQQDRRDSPRRSRAPAAAETRRVVTILFVEPAVGEPGLDPEMLRPALERSLEQSEEILARRGATVERAPDGTFMAIFGSPVAHEDDAVRGLRAAAELRELGVVSRAAVETGDVLAGGDTTVRGPVVRAAARLLAAAAADEILAGELTRRLAAGSAQFEAVDADGQTIWRVLGVSPGAPARPLFLDVAFVGRDKEIAELRSALSAAVQERRPGLVTVVAEPGVGKSRLAREFVLAEGQARMLTGRCLAYGDGITYWPLPKCSRSWRPTEPSRSLKRSWPA
jgi:DNA-binding SARP family transcriptional activator